MKDLETMQREGREYWGVHVAPGHGQHHQEKILDQHTANVWMAAQESTLKDLAQIAEKHYKELSK